MEHYEWDAVRTEVMSPKIKRKVISGEKAMVAQVFLAKGAVALEDTLDLDIFSPIRHDWLKGQDDYLRQG